MTDRMIDALIAEKLFGWKWYTSPNGFRVLFSPSDSMLVNTEDAPCYVEREGPYQRTPNYSTNPADSKLLEDVLIAKHKVVSILMTQQCCTVRLGSESAPDSVVMVPSDQKMRGLCNAAIRALKESE